MKLLTFCLAATSLAVAQSPLSPHSPHSPPRPGATANHLGTDRPLPPLLTPIHTQPDDTQGGAYGTWAAGADYKVSFHDGATFIPCLGGDYPHNQPFRWRTTSVKAGEHELVTQPARGRQRSETRFEFELGGVVEAYDVRLDGLEQTFVIASAPSQPGDLVVTGEVATALRAPAAPSRHQHLSFADEAGTPILSYGAAVAVDARGKRIPMTTTWRDGAIELRLAAAAVAELQFPLTVDPLMQNLVTLETWSGSFGTPRNFDVLREDERPADNVWICFTRETSFQDHDLWIFRTEDDLPGSLFHVAYADLSSTWSNHSCAVAHADSRVICAFVREFADDTRNVRWHTHHVDDLNFRTGVGGFTASNNNWRVDIGGNLALSPNQRAMVVYQHESGATFANGSDSQSRGFYIDLSGITTTTGQGTFVDDTLLYGGGSTDSERPRINQVASGNTSGNRWCVVHQFYDTLTSGDDWDVWCDFWDDTGNLLTFDLIEPDNGEHKLGPIVAGTNGRYLVCWAGVDPALVGQTPGRVGTTLYSQRVDFDGTSMQYPHTAERYLWNNTSTVNMEVTGLAYDGQTRSHWLAVSRAGATVWADLMGFRGRTMTFEALYTGNNINIIEYGGAASYNRDDGSYVLVGSAYQAGSSPVFGNVWSNQSIPTPTLSGTSCSPVSLYWNSASPLPMRQRLGSEFESVVGFFPGGTPVILATSLNPANFDLTGIQPFANGCRLLVDSGAGLLTTIGGTGMGLAPVTWPLPLTENIPPLTLYFQAFLLDLTTGRFVSTRRLSVPLDY